MIGVQHKYIVLIFLIAFSVISSASNILNEDDESKSTQLEPKEQIVSSYLNQFLIKLLRAHSQGQALVKPKSSECEYNCETAKYKKSKASKYTLKTSFMDTLYG